MQPFLWIWLLITPIVYAVFDLIRMSSGTARPAANATRLAGARRAPGA